MSGVVWSSSPLVLLLALAFDAALGDPRWLWTRAPHPVTLIGRLISFFDRRFNRENDSDTRRRTNGIAAMAALVIGAAVLGFLLEWIFARAAGGWIVSALLGSVFLAQRSLYEHVAAVRNALLGGGVDAGRRAVGMIVGRDTAVLDEAGISRAAIESCAENFSDGIVAPAFWFAALGWPGLLIYKITNTADSMIGHRTARHESFGWAAARLDDVLNLLPARLSAVLVAAAAPIAGGSMREAFAVTLRDARLHRSPNAGWPESAMAGALGLALAGPRRYGARVVDDPFLNKDGRRDANAGDISRALKILVLACILHAAIYTGVAIVLATSGN
jgi:adenosylcobinamide-phosphate synthase